MRLSDSQARRELAHGIFSFGVSSVSNVMEKSQRFTLDRPDGTSILANITYPTLVTDTRDSLFSFDVQQIYEKLAQLEDEVPPGQSRRVLPPQDCVSRSEQLLTAVKHCGSQVIRILYDINKYTPGYNSSPILPKLPLSVTMKPVIGELGQ
ncbi:hypothetical protein F5X98DRAFT_317979 [Xylaria grammica]|nr:hypothetical protein F5X98DRAFT_317979 [Xylaria grammica]